MLKMELLTHHYYLHHLTHHLHEMDYLIPTALLILTLAPLLATLPLRMQVLSHYRHQQMDLLPLALLLAAAALLALPAIRH
jgi:hypothetical protein